MHINIVSPQELEEKKRLLVNKAIDLMNKQARSSDKYARKMRAIEYELRRIEGLLDGKTERGSV